MCLSKVLVSTQMKPTFYLKITYLCESDFKMLIKCSQSAPGLKICMSKFDEMLTIHQSYEVICHIKMCHGNSRQHFCKV